MAKIVIILLLIFCCSSTLAQTDSIFDSRETADTVERAPNYPLMFAAGSAIFGSIFFLERGQLTDYIPGDEAKALNFAGKILLPSLAVSIAIPIMGNYTARPPASYISILPGFLLGSYSMIQIASAKGIPPALRYIAESSSVTLLSMLSYYLVRPKHFEPDSSKADEGRIITPKEPSWSLTPTVTSYSASLRVSCSF